MGNSPRQLQIQNCLLEHLRHRPYSSISISELCRQAGLSRRSFYLYYKDKDDCLYCLINRVFQDLLRDTYAALPENASDLDACRTHLEMFQKYRPYFDLTVFHTQLDSMVGHIVQCATQGGEFFLPTRKVSKTQVDPDLLACLICSQVVLLLRWQYTQYSTPIEEMARKLLKVTDIVIPPDAG